MKTVLLSLLLVSAWLFIGFTCSAQPKESDRNWIDSLAVKYRIDFIESAMLHDQAALDSMGAKVDVLIFSMSNPQRFERTAAEDFVTAIRKYRYESEAHKLRRRAYVREIESIRNNFIPL